MGLLYIDLHTGKAYLFHDANDYLVIQTCADEKQIGRVITFEHDYDLNPFGAGDYYFLVDARAPRRNERRTGKAGRLGIIGPDGANLKRFLAKICGQGELTPDDSPKVPPELEGRVIKCGNERLKRSDLQFLDGTREVRFMHVGGEFAGMIMSLESAMDCINAP